MLNETKKSLLWGVVSSAALMFFYFIVLALANSFPHALEQFSILWYWITALVIGFGIQVGLYAYIRYRARKRKIKGMTGEIVAVGGVSTGSMVACCAHHLIDVLPILGLSVAFLFLAQYQVFFLIFGIISNIIGIIFMLEIIKKYSLYRKFGVLSRLERFNIRTLKRVAIAAGSVILVISFFWIKYNNVNNYFSATEARADEQNIFIEETFSLPAKTNSGGGLTIDVNPINFSFNMPVRFKIEMNTHQGNLEFDITKQSILFDGLGNKYFPIEWDGGVGGHHISGILTFPIITKQDNIIKLTINDIYGVKERVFEWELN